MTDSREDRRLQDPSAWIIVRRDGTVVTAEREACALIGALDPDALGGRPWASLIRDPEAPAARAATRALADGGAWEGDLAFWHQGAPSILRTTIRPISTSSELMVVSLLPGSRETAGGGDMDATHSVHSSHSEDADQGVPGQGAASRQRLSQTFIEASAARTPGDGVAGLQALVEAYDAMYDLDDAAAAARSVLQALRTAIPFEWAAIVRVVHEGGTGDALQVVTAYPSPMAGVSRGVSWSLLSEDERLVLATGEPSIQGLLEPPTRGLERRAALAGSPLDRLPAFGLRSRILVPLFAGGRVAGALALFRQGAMGFDAADGVLSERTTRRLGELVAAELPAEATTSEPQDASPRPSPGMLPPMPPPPGPPAPWGAAGSAPEASAPATPDASEARPPDERLESLGEVVAGVAHELNNPLTAILGYAQIVSGLEGNEREHALRTIEDEAQRAARIVRNLLSFARQRPGERRSVNLDETVRRVVDLRRYSLEADDIRVTLRLGRLPAVEVDETQFEQVFLHLLDNAQQALQGRGGEILVSTWRTDEGVYISVADDGPGVPEGLRTRVFEPFFTTREVGHGEGMGLAVVYGVARNHGGRAWVEPNLQGGATFVVEVPLSKRASDAALGPTSPTFEPDR